MQVPVEYFCTLDNDGRRRDADERPELAKGSAEYVAPAEYMVRFTFSLSLLSIFNMNHVYQTMFQCNGKKQRTGFLFNNCC